MEEEQHGPFVSHTEKLVSVTVLSVITNIQTTTTAVVDPILQILLLLHLLAVQIVMEEALTALEAKAATAVVGLWEDVEGCVMRGSRGNAIEEIVAVFRMTILPTFASHIEKMAPVNGRSYAGIDMNDELNEVGNVYLRSGRIG